MSNAVSRSSFDAAVAAAFCAAWWGLWLLWPSREGEPAMERGAPPAPGTRFLLNARTQGRSVWSPTLIVAPPRWIMPETRNVDGAPDVTGPTRFDSSAVLQRQTNVQPARTESFVSGRHGLDAGFIPGPLAPIGPVGGFERRTNTVIVLPATLSARAFVMAEVPRSAFAGLDRGALVRANVEINESGEVTHVFLDQRSGAAEADAAVLRALYISRAGVGEGACNGTVVIGLPAGTGGGGEELPRR